MLRPTSSPEKMRLGPGGDALGDSVGFDTEEVPARSRPRVAWDGEVRARQHQGSLVHPLGLRASGNLAQFSHLEDSGACPTSGTPRRLEHSLKRGLG
jgi:hypothetical protein